VGGDLGPSSGSGSQIDDDTVGFAGTRRCEEGGMAGGEVEEFESGTGTIRGGFIGLE
jgi:hypothetical protein